MISADVAGEDASDASSDSNRIRRINDRSCAMRASSSVLSLRGMSPWRFA
jgi:hypothetical protein